MPSKEVLYYTHNQGDPLMLTNCREQIKLSVPEEHIVCISQIPTKFGRNIVVPLPPNEAPSRGLGWLNLAEKILTGLRETKGEVIFFCEHDVLYHPSHFDFTPASHELFYYNTNVWRVRKADGFALYCEDTRQLSGMVAYRDLLLTHFEKRYALLKKYLDEKGIDGFNSYVRAMGFEPGTHGRPERVDNYGSENYLSAFPNIDIRHDTNVTSSRWKKEQFRNQRYTRGWTESNIDDIPGWTDARKLMNMSPKSNA